MAKKIIDRIVDDMVDGLECPVELITNGKKHFNLVGEFMTVECEPVNGDRAFSVYGDNPDIAFFVEITKVDSTEN